MGYSYFLHDWITQMETKKEALFVQATSPKQKTEEKDIAQNFDQIVTTILNLIKEYLNYREHGSPQITIYVNSVQQADVDEYVICDFRIVDHQIMARDNKQFFRCLSHVPKKSLGHVFSPGMVWVATELKQTIKLILETSL